MNTSIINLINFLICSVIYISGMFYSGISYSLDSNALNKTSIGVQNTTHFKVFYKSRIDPLPLNKIHSWVVHLDTIEGQPVEKAKISVYGGMPAHKHGLPTQPAVRELGGGDYLVEGLKFSMNGDWEIWLNIRVMGVTDKVKFEIDL